VYNEKIQFAHMIIHDINAISTFVVEFLRRNIRCWYVRKQMGLGATLVDLVFIKESKKGKAMEQHFVET
jgi:hypothetical protein